MSRRFAPLSFSAGGALGAGAALALVLNAGAARADVVSNVNPSNCRSAQFDQVSLFTRGTGTTHSIQAKATNTQNYTVYCPITKKSSGPGVIANDGIKTVAVTTSTAGLVDCTIMTRRVSVSGYADQNNVGPTIEGSTTTAKTFTITTPSTRPSRYWDANNTPPAGTDYDYTPAWYYSYLACTMAPGAKMSGDIVVTELGSSTGYTIDPMFTCPLTSDMAWRFDDLTSEGAGYTMAQASGSAHQFQFACPVPTNAMVEVAATTTYTNPSGCNLNSSNFSAFTWSLMDSGNSSQWPSRMLSRPYLPVISVPVTGTNNLYCGQNATSGDGKWFSYRVLPNGVHTAAPDSWVASASDGVASVNNALDANPSTRWTTGKAGKTGMYYQVYVGTNKVFNEITFDSGADGDDYPRLFTVLGGYDGTNFYEIGQGAGSNHFVSLDFGEEPYSYYRIRLDQDIKDAGGATKYWSIRELNLYLNDGTH
jgi:hypothetical protein